MTLAVGDHLIIRRNGKILTPQDEGWHEYEVVAGMRGEDRYNFIQFSQEPLSKHNPKTSCVVKLEVVE